MPGLVNGAPATPSLPVLSFTGERIVPGEVDLLLFREHQARYVFAGGYVKDKSVLDVACGAGMGTAYLLDSGARTCVGLDVDYPSVASARATYKKCNFAQCDAEKFCLAENSLDVVVSFETIEHLADQQTFLRECHRALRNSGVFICSTPNRKLSRWAPRNPYHIHEIEIDEFDRLLRAEFAEVKLFAQGTQPYWPFVARALLWRAIDFLQLKSTIWRLFGRKPDPRAVRTKFDANVDKPDGSIQEYQENRQVQPAYVIAVARKSP
jgi:SAM-dependent methyltransferase